MNVEKRKTLSDWLVLPFLLLFELRLLPAHLVRALLYPLPLQPFHHPLLDPGLDDISSL
jgi:hypothetical protein